MSWRLTQALTDDLFIRDHRVEVVDSCTCSGGGEFPHEPHCGIEPIDLTLPIVWRKHGKGARW